MLTGQELKEIKADLAQKTDTRAARLVAEVDRLREEGAWVRKKLKLPEDTPLFTGGGVTLAGTLHVVCSHARGYEMLLSMTTFTITEPEQGEGGR